MPLDHGHQLMNQRYHQRLQYAARQLQLQQLVCHKLGLQVLLNQNFLSNLARRPDHLRDTNQVSALLIPDLQSGLHLQSLKTLLIPLTYLTH